MLATDLASEGSYKWSSDRMQRHHGVNVPISAIRKMTYKHAARAKAIALKQPAPKHHQQIVVEMDGTMVPIVKTSEGEDRRKTRKYEWAEIKAAVAQIRGNQDWKYAISFESAEELGDRLGVVLRDYLGWDGESLIHGLGDGAIWICQQLERVAGCRCRYTIDLFHLCEYFAKAAEAWTTDIGKETSRLRDLIKGGQEAIVLQELQCRLEQFPGHNGIEACIRYIKNRPGQFDYPKAIKDDLPIGSGKVESTNRHLIQARLKRPGAWWTKRNAALMGELRVARENGLWDELWDPSSFRRAA
jgi:hypothetical protein